MSNFKEITPQQITQNPFTLIGKDWMLVTAAKDGAANTMTASWGGVGVMWNKNVTYVAIRPQRFTKEFIDGSETFSLSILGESYRKQLSYLGSVSGRDENKIQNAGLTVAYENQTPYFEEAELVLICKKLFAQPYSKEAFLGAGLIEKNYSQSDYHTLYISEIIKVLSK